MPCMRGGAGGGGYTVCHNCSCANARYNVKRRLAKHPPLSEEQFAEVLEQETEVGGWVWEEGGGLVCAYAGGGEGMGGAWG